MLQSNPAKSVAKALVHFKCSNRPVLVACSGGGDSVALALLTAQHHNNSVILVFIQHHLRGNDSILDAQSVVALAELLNQKTRCKVLPHIIEAPLGPTTGKGTEATARNLRRSHLATLAKSTRAAAVFMGHTLDDQAETVLLRLIRGAGTSALGGIRMRSCLPDFSPLVRPLLSTPRSDLRSILVCEGIPWREDASNFSEAFTRNIIRHDVLKRLSERFGPIVIQRLARHASWMAEQGRRERIRVRNMLALCELPRAGPKIVLKLQVLSTFKASDIASLVHLLWLREKWPASELTRHHLHGLAKHILRGTALPGLPGGIELKRDNHVVSLGPLFSTRGDTPNGV